MRILALKTVTSMLGRRSLSTKNFPKVTHCIFDMDGLLLGAERLVRHLAAARVPAALATSSSARSVETKVAAHRDLFRLFSHKVMGSSDPEVKFGKPHPDIFLVAAARFPDRPDPSKCLVFEDSPHGAAAGAAAGMAVVMVPERALPPHLTAHATLVLPSLAAFRPELFGLPPFP